MEQAADKAAELRSDVAEEKKRLREFADAEKEERKRKRAERLAAQQAAAAAAHAAHAAMAAGGSGGGAAAAAEGGAEGEEAADASRGASAAPEGEGPAAKKARTGSAEPSKAARVRNGMGQAAPRRSGCTPTLGASACLASPSSNHNCNQRRPLAAAATRRTATRRSRPGTCLTASRSTGGAGGRRE